MFVISGPMLGQFESGLVAGLFTPPSSPSSVAESLHPGYIGHRSLCARTTACKNQIPTSKLLHFCLHSCIMQKNSNSSAGGAGGRSPFAGVWGDPSFISSLTQHRREHEMSTLRVTENSIEEARGSCCQR